MSHSRGGRKGLHYYSLQKVTEEWVTQNQNVKGNPFFTLRGLCFHLSSQYTARAKEEGWYTHLGGRRGQDMRLSAGIIHVLTQNGFESATYNRQQSRRGRYGFSIRYGKAFYSLSTKDNPTKSLPPSYVARVSRGENLGL